MWPNTKNSIEKALFYKVLCPFENKTHFSKFQSIFETVQNCLWRHHRNNWKFKKKIMQSFSPSYKVSLYLLPSIEIWKGVPGAVLPSWKNPNFKNSYLNSVSFSPISNWNKKTELKNTFPMCYNVNLKIHLIWGLLRLFEIYVWRHRLNMYFWKFFYMILFLT